MKKYGVLAVCMLLFTVSTARAEFYRWVDKDGKEFFTNERDKVPQEYRAGSTAVNPDEKRVSVGTKNAMPDKKGSAVSAHKDKYGKGEDYWRMKATNLRLKLRGQQDDYDLVVKQLDDQDQKPKKSAARTKKAHTSLEKKKMKLEKDIAATRKMLEVDLPEEARKADAYPGWIRE